VSTISPSDETGGLFGVMEAVESVTGIVGPTLGGLVVAWGAARGYEQPALLAVLAAYGLLAVAVASHYDATVMHQARTLAFANLKAASGESVRDEAGDKIKAE
jgi:MFS family permease